MLNDIFSVIMDTSLKGTLIIITILMICTFGKKLSSEFKYMFLLISVISLIILPLSAVIAKSYSVPVFQPLQYSVNEESDINENFPVKFDIQEKPLEAQVENKAQYTNDNKLIPYFTYIWLGGFILFILKMLVGIIGSFVFPRNAVPVSQQNISDLLENLKQGIGIKRRVSLYICKQSISPMTIGIFRHKIVVPFHAPEWEMDRWRVVLLHELFHVKRKDNFLQIIVGIVSAVYWLNPFVWIAVKWLYREREGACDNSVIAYGVTPVAYATQLLEIMKLYKTPGVWNSAANSIAHSAKAEKRIKKILSSNESQQLFGTKRLIFITIFIMCLIVPLSLVNITASGANISFGLMSIDLNDDSVNITCKNPSVDIRNVRVEEIPSRWPLIYYYGSILNGFGPNRDPATGKIVNMEDIKIDVLHNGKPIAATANGRVVSKYEDSSGRCRITIQHKYGFASVYSDIYRPRVREGDNVSQGDVIGFAAINHIFSYKITKDGKAIDPIPFINISTRIIERNHSKK